MVGVIVIKMVVKIFKKCLIIIFYIINDQKDIKDELIYKTTL